MSLPRVAQAPARQIAPERAGRELQVAGDVRRREAGRLLRGIDRLRRVDRGLSRVDPEQDAPK